MLANATKGCARKPPGPIILSGHVHNANNNKMVKNGHLCNGSHLDQNLRLCDYTANTDFGWGVAIS